MGEAWSSGCQAEHEVPRRQSWVLHINCEQLIVSETPGTRGLLAMPCDQHISFFLHRSTSLTIGQS